MTLVTGEGVEIMRKIDLTQVERQVGTAVIHASTGKIEKATGLLDGERGAMYCMCVWRMLPGIAESLKGEPLKKFSVNLTGTQLIMALFMGKLYCVRKNPL